MRARHLGNRLGGTDFVRNKIGASKIYYIDSRLFRVILRQEEEKFYGRLNWKNYIPTRLKNVVCFHESKDGTVAVNALLPCTILMLRSGFPSE